MNSRTSHRLFFRTLAFLLAFSLGLSGSASALRQENASEAGLEEGLRGRLSPGAAALFRKASLEEVGGLWERVQDANRLDVYRERLVKKGARYLLVKTEESNQDGKRSPWPTKNNPIRAYTIFRILRALGCNVCDVEIPYPAERQWISDLTGADAEKLYVVDLSTNYSVGDPEVLQGNPHKELTRRILASFFVRFWDPHVNNTGPLRQDGFHAQADMPTMMFDAEESLHSEMNNRERFLFLFARHYMTETSLVNLERSTRKDKGEDLILHTNPAPLADGLDPEESKRFVRDAVKLNLDTLKQSVLNVVLERYGADRREEITGTVGELFSSLRQWQNDFPMDAPWFVGALFDGFSDGRIGVFVQMPKESEPAFNKKRDAIEVALDDAREELAVSRTAGLEEEVGGLRRWTQDRVIQVIRTANQAGQLSLAPGAVHSEAQRATRLGKELFHAYAAVVASKSIPEFPDWPSALRAAGVNPQAHYRYRTKSVPSTAGLEEDDVREGRVVVLDAALVGHSAGLEEFLWRLEGVAPYADRVIVLGPFSGSWDRIQKVRTEQELGVLLWALEERIPSVSLTYVGLEERVPHLQALLRGHPNVTFRAPPVQGTNLLALLAAGLGMPEELAGELATGLEEAEIRGRAA